MAARASGSPSSRRTSARIRLGSVPTSNALPLATPFGPLGLFAENQQRHAQSRCLFLHPAGIAEDEVGAAHHRQHRAMAARFDQVDALDAPEQRPHGPRDVPIGMKHEPDVDKGSRRKRPERAGNGFEALAPAFAAVAGDKQLRPSSFAEHGRGEGGLGGEKGVDAGVPGEEYGAWDGLGGKVGRGSLRRREEQGRLRVDGGAIALLGPGRGGVAGSKSGLHVRDRNRAVEGGLRGAERAGRVALDHEQGWRRRQMTEHRPANPRDVGVGLGKAGAIERDPRQVAKVMFGKVEVRDVGRCGRPGNRARARQARRRPERA